MNRCNPDRWVVVEISSKDEIQRRVLASWYGGYTGGNSWQMSSGVIAVTVDGDFYEFLNHSGSVYVCHKNFYGMSAYTSGIYAGYAALANEDYKIRILDENTDFKGLEYVRNE